MNRLSLLRPIPPDRLPRRLIQLYCGLVLYGLSSSLLVLAGLGLDSWNVFHQGLSHHTGLPIGTWSIIVGVVVLLFWIPLRQRPGVGTLCNVVIIGLVIDIVLAHVPSPGALPVRALCLLLGVFLNGVATGAYIGAGLGPGPRDGLMLGLAQRGHSIRVARTCIEVTVLITGFLLGGSVGVGTLLYALSIGPLAHFFIPHLAIDKYGAPGGGLGGPLVRDEQELVAGA
ncbi:MAG: YczE/YyaS/YitT family protein [Chloroflexota bacterium]